MLCAAITGPTPITTKQLPPAQYFDILGGSHRILGGLQTQETSSEEEEQPSGSFHGEALGSLSPSGAKKFTEQFPSGAKKLIEQFQSGAKKFTEQFPIGAKKFTSSAKKFRSSRVFFLHVV